MAAPPERAPVAARTPVGATGQAGSAEPARTRLEGFVSGVLRAGVTVSSLVVISGIAVTLASASSRASASRAVGQLRRGILSPSGLQAPHSVPAVIRAVGHGGGPALMMLGLLLLILTPVMRVAVSVVGFALDRDRRYVLITLTVLGVLIGSFALGA
jgi:uncharacterized membrane protein